MAKSIQITSENLGTLSSKIMKDKLPAMDLDFILNNLDKLKPNQLENYFSHGCYYKMAYSEEVFLKVYKHLTKAIIMDIIQCFQFTKETFNKITSEKKIKGDDLQSLIFKFNNNITFQPRPQLQYLIDNFSEIFCLPILIGKYDCFGPMREYPTPEEECEYNSHLFINSYLEKHFKEGVLQFFKLSSKAYMGPRPFETINKFYLEGKLNLTPSELSDLATSIQNRCQGFTREWELKDFLRESNKFEFFSTGIIGEVIQPFKVLYQLL